MGSFLFSSNFKFSWGPYNGKNLGEVPERLYHAGAPNPSSLGGRLDRLFAIPEGPTISANISNLNRYRTPLGKSLASRALWLSNNLLNAIPRILPD
jgi:hypothetical protein